jgi:hypothetical protein
MVTILAYEVQKSAYRLLCFADVLLRNVNCCRLHTFFVSLVLSMLVSPEM